MSQSHLLIKKFAYVARTASGILTATMILCMAAGRAGAQQTGGSGSESGKKGSSAKDSSASQSDGHRSSCDHLSNNIGLFYPVSSNGSRAKSMTNFISINAIAGLSYGETTFSMAGISNIVFDTASGFQVAGFSNHIYNRSGGLQMAGFMNFVKVRSEGVAIAGFMNLAGSQGVASIAGFGNFSRRNTTGVQIAGFMNKSANVKEQVSGFINTADSSDVQVAGFLNRSTVARVQVGGFINVARKVKVVQVGFINVADSNELPIGVFNFIKNGERTIGVSTDETLTTLLSFRSGGSKLYGIAGVGYNGKGTRDLAAWEAGIGRHWTFSEDFRLNVELLSIGLTDFKHGDSHRSALRVTPSFHLSRMIEIYGGPSLNYIITDKSLGLDVVDHYLWSKTRSKSIEGMYIGVTGGVTVRL